MMLEITFCLDVLQQPPSVNVVHTEYCKLEQNSSRFFISPKLIFKFVTICSHFGIFNNIRFHFFFMIVYKGKWHSLLWRQFLKSWVVFSSVDYNSQKKEKTVINVRRKYWLVISYAINFKGTSIKIGKAFLDSWYFCLCNKVCIG